MNDIDRIECGECLKTFSLSVITFDGFSTTHSLPHNTGYFQVSPLLMAAQNGHTKCVTLLLQNGSNVLQRDSEDRNCLMLAIQNHHKYGELGTRAAIIHYHTQAHRQGVRGVHSDPTIGLQRLYTPLKCTFKCPTI